jgi:hypothetical protein
VIVAAGCATFDYTRVTALCALPIVVRTALQLAAAPPGLPRFLRRLPFPLLFLLQFQIEGGNHVRDSRWFYALQSPPPRPIVDRHDERDHAGAVAPAAQDRPALSPRRLAADRHGDRPGAQAGRRAAEL